MITEDYVSFEIAKSLKERGFNEPCECFYDTENNDVSIVSVIFLIFVVEKRNNIKTE